MKFWKISSTKNSKGPQVFFDYKQASDEWLDILVHDDNVSAGMITRAHEMIFEMQDERNGLGRMAIGEWMIEEGNTDDK